MAITPMKKVADMPLDSNNKRVVQGAAWDANFTAIEQKFNGGILAAEIAANQVVKGIVSGGGVTVTHNPDDTFTLVAVNVAGDLLNFAANNSLTPRGGVQFLSAFREGGTHTRVGAWREYASTGYPDERAYKVDGGASAAKWKVGFTGTGLVLWTSSSTDTTRTIYVSVDGGAFNPLSATIPAVNVSAHRIALVTGLAQGVHTVEFYQNEAYFFTVGGFDVIGPTNPQTDSGVGYVSGTRVTPAAKTDLAPGAIGTSKSRADLIVVDNAGVVSLVAGTPDTSVRAYRVEAETGQVSRWFLKAADGRFITPPHADPTKPDGPRIWRNGFSTLTAQANASGGAVLQTIVSGDYIIIGWVGTQLDLIAYASGGVSSITAVTDGTSTDISASISTNLYNKAITVASAQPYGYHQTKILNSQAAQTLYVDAFDVYVPSLPSIGANQMAVGYTNIMPTAPTGTGAMAAALMGAWVRHEEDKGVVFNGSWSVELAAFDSGGSGRYSSGTSTPTTDYAEFAFVGTGIRLISRAGGNFGIAAVSIDGGAETNVDMYAVSGNQALVYAITGLTFGAHTIKVRKTGTKNASASDYNVFVDAFDVLQPIEVVDVRTLSPVMDQTQALMEAHLDPQGHPHVRYPLIYDSRGVQCNERFEVLYVLHGAASSGANSFSITFNKAFSIPPRVLVTPNNPTALTTYVQSVYSVTTTGASIYYNAGSSGDTQFAVLVVGY